MGTPNPIDRNTALLKIHLIPHAMSGSQPSTARLNFFFGGGGKRGCQTLGVVFLNSERCLEKPVAGLYCAQDGEIPSIQKDDDEGG